MIKNKLLKEINDNGITEAFIMMYFYDKVVMGYYKNNDLVFGDSFEDDFLTEYHVFNSDMEIRGDSEHTVIIKDTEDVLEEKMFIIGNQSNVTDGKSIVTQNGRTMLFPAEIHFKNVKENPLRLVVHHLFGNDGSICGYRLAGIEGVE